MQNKAIFHTKMKKRVLTLVHHHLICNEKHKDDSDNERDIDDKDDKEDRGDKDDHEDVKDHNEDDNDNNDDKQHDDEKDHEDHKVETKIDMTRIMDAVRKLSREGNERKTITF